MSTFLVFLFTDTYYFYWQHKSISQGVLLILLASKQVKYQLNTMDMQ